MINILTLTRKILPNTLLTFKTAYTLIILNEYKFYVDFKGIMYFDDGGPISPTNIIKDKKFLKKFYLSLKNN
jgi:hypothetical protein